MYHWEKNEGGGPPRLSYRGLTFPVWAGFLSRDEIRSKKTYYAYFGGTKLTEQAVRYHVDHLIDKGVYLPKAA